MPRPARFAPMLAASAGTLPDRLAGWTIEPKWDGIRVIAEVSARGVRLWTRNGNDKGPQFPEVVDALKALAADGGPLVLDGEIVALDPKGHALRFQALQGRMHAESEETRADGGHAVAALMVTDIAARGTTLLVAGDVAAVARAFGAAGDDDGAIDLPGVMSRKKQVVPKLLSA